MEGNSGDARGRLRRLLRLAVVDTAPLRRHRDFRLLYIGQAVSMFGGMVRYVALPYQIFRLTHSSLAVGLLGLAEIFPILIFAFVGGALADAHDRRRMVQLTELGLAVMSGLLAGNALLTHPFLPVLYVLAGIMAAFDALQRPSLDALLPRLVDRSELTAASALSSLQSTSGMILGPAIGGVLVAAVGLPVTYGVDVLSFVVSLMALSRMRAVPPPAEATKPSVRGVIEGVRYARSRPELMGTYLVDMVAMFFGMPNALFPALAFKYGGAGVLGLLYAAPAVGSLVASGTSGWSRHVHRHGLAVVLAALGWGVSIVLFGLVAWLPGALIFLGLAGAADEISGLFRSTIWNQTIPDTLRGRLAGIEMISYTSGPAFGDLESGTIAALFSVRVSVVSGGVLCVVGTVLMALALPAFVKYDARSHLGTEQALTGRV